MRTAFDRRQKILRFLSDRRATTLRELSSRYQVSLSTVRRDLDALSMDYPIYTRQGVGGGIFVLEGFHYRQTEFHLDPEQEELLSRLYLTLQGRDKELMGEIIAGLSHPLSR